jgi:hypothetical protein
MEKYQRLSKSWLWKLQESAYTQFGPEAWSTKGVPFYLTGSPLTARQYAHVLLGYIRDSLSPLSPSPIDLSEPLYILDLGAGTGMLGYLFLKKFFSLIEGLPFEKLKLKYVMTDFVESNIASCQGNPCLQPYIEAGVLDFAHYRSESSQPIRLLGSGTVLSKERLINPLILIANYFFDSIQHDLFMVKDGALLEGRIHISPPKARADTPKDPSIIATMKCTYEYTPIDDLTTYYPNPRWVEILQEYSKNFDAIPFLFPCGALQSIEYFSELSRGRLLVLAEDQGVCTEAQIRDWGEPKIARHGSFSLPVNYHALRRYFANQGGIGLLTSLPDPVFAIGAFVLGGPAHQHPETCLAFRELIDYFDPKDYWNIVGCATRRLKTASLEELLLLVKLGEYDPVNFNHFFERIRALIPKASEAEKHVLFETIRRVGEHFFPVGPESGNFVGNLGVLCFDLGEFRTALEYFKASIPISGESKETLMNIVNCYKAIQHSGNGP